MTEPRLKLWSKVKIKSLDDLNKLMPKYEHDKWKYDFIDDMFKSAGKTCTVTESYYEGNTIYYRFSEIGYRWDERLLDIKIDDITEKVYNILRGEKS